jgi:histidyl-tRNA synthetase
MATKKPQIQSAPGVSDILPKDQPAFDKVFKISSNFAKYFNFKKITPPILEYTELFEKGTGEFTDIVEKQMYNLKTRGGAHLTLRPEFTPSLVRAYIEHGMHSLPQPVKLFSYGPLFRHERQQAGRYRQFNQINFEIFGADKPIAEVEVIYVMYSILEKLGIKNLIIEINSIGDKECRADYKKALVKYLKKHENFLCSTCKKRLKTNPMRILDCKEEKCHNAVVNAPQIIDHLCKPCHSHFKKVLEYLDQLGLPYNLNPYLARGLDYYTRTVFEIVTQNEDKNKQGTLIGGGRYDNLIRQFSRKEIPACGAAGGVERIISLMKEVPEDKPKIFLAQLGDEAKIRALKLLEEFKKSKILVAESLDKDSLTNQLKTANKLEVAYTLIIGEEEAKKDSILIRDMKTGKQTSVKMSNIIKEIKKKL